MKRAVILLLFVSLGLNIGLGVALKRQRDVVESLPPWAHQDGAGRGQRDGHGPRRDGIPKERMERMREMRKRIEPELSAQRDVFRAAREALHEALGRESVDEAEIMARVGDMIAAQGGIDSLVVSNLIKELRHMSPEDRQEVLRMLDRFGMGSRGRGRGRPPVSP